MEKMNHGRVQRSGRVQLNPNIAIMLVAVVIILGIIALGAGAS